MAQIDFGLLDRDAPQQAGASFDQGRRNVLAMQLAQQQQEQNALSMGKMRQDDENRNALRNISQQSGGDPQRIIQGMYAQGMPTEALAMQGHVSQQQNSEVARAMALLKLMGESSYQVFQRPEASFAVQKLTEFGRVSGQDMSGEIQKVQMMSPEQIQQWAKGGMTSAQEHEQKFKTFQHGNTIFSAVADPATGQLTQGGSIVIPESEADKRKSEMEQARINLMKAQEDRLTNPPVPKPKPLPASTTKLQTDELTSIGTFSGIDADLAGFEKQIEDGKLDFGLIKNAANTGRNQLGMSTAESRNFASFKAKLESMRNSILLLNKGVQTEGDAQRAMNEILTNLNDKELVKQRLTELRSLNKRAVDIRKNNVDTLRSTYGHDPFDFEKYENQPGTTNLTPTGGRPPLADIFK